MIGPSPGTRVWLVAGVTDMRKGFDGLSASVNNCIHDDSYSGHLFVFRGRKGDQIKVLWWDGDGLCLFAKRLEKGKFEALGKYLPNASNYTIAEATASQSLPDWIGSHQRAFAFFGGVTELLIPDNLKSGITMAHRYEPDINPTYHDMAQHYGVAVIPARVRRPKDKAKAEVGVQIVERWILAALRHHTFLSLQQLNRRITELLVLLNNRPFRKLPGSRRSQFDTLDRPALKALPASAYVYADWKKARVNIDYHIEVDRHYYSVPYSLVKQELDVRFTVNTVECFYRNQRIASHVRSYRAGHHTTVREHMPESHRQYGDWSPERLVRWARQFGTSTAEVVTLILQARRHPEQGFRSCLGLLRLEKTYARKGWKRPASGHCY